MKSGLDGAARLSSPKSRPTIHRRTVSWKGKMPRTALDCAHEPERIAVGRSDAQCGRWWFWCLCARWEEWLWCAHVNCLVTPARVFPLGSFAFFCVRTGRVASSLNSKPEQPLRPAGKGLCCLLGKANFLACLHLQRLAARTVHGKPHLLRTRIGPMNRGSNLSVWTLDVERWTVCCASSKRRRSLS